MNTWRYVRGRNRSSWSWSTFAISANHSPESLLPVGSRIGFMIPWHTKIASSYDVFSVSASLLVPQSLTSANGGFYPY